MGKNALNPQQERFVQEYLKALNATQAAKVAGYSDKTAHVQGSKLLKHPKVREAVAAAQRERAERTAITADAVLEELWRIARSDITKALDGKGNLLPVSEMPPEAKAAIASLDTDELFEGKGDERTQVGLSRKVRNWDKVKALELVGKHLGMWKDKVEVSGEGGQALSISIDLGAGK